MNRPTTSEISVFVVPITSCKSDNPGIFSSSLPNKYLISKVKFVGEYCIVVVPVVVSCSEGLITVIALLNVLLAVPKSASPDPSISLQLSLGDS